MATKVTEADEKQNKNKRSAIVMEFGVSIHSGVDKFHLWDLEEKDALFEELSMAMKKAKKEVKQILSTKIDLWQKTGSHATTWSKTSETGRWDKQGPDGNMMAE